MVAAFPLDLLKLLKDSDSSVKEAAWDQLISGHSRLLMSVARSLGGDHDAAMDRYTYVLGKLRESDFKRLRAFDSGRGAAFSTWLVATARNLCLDHHRSVFGRSRAIHTQGIELVVAAARRALNEAFGGDLPVDADSIEDESMSAEAMTAARHRNDCLRSEVANLTARERLLITLRFRDDLSAARIAQVVGLPTPFHVYRQLRSILEHLRKGLERRGIEGPDD